MKPLLLILVLLLASCVTVSDIPGTDPDWIYGQGEGKLRTEAEQTAREDFLSRALQERGGDFVREELWKVQGGSGAPTSSYAVQMRQKRVGELPPLVPVFSARLDNGSWRTIYRVARAEWAQIEAAHQALLNSQLAADWTLAAAKDDLALAMTDRLEALLRLAARMEAEGIADLALPEQGVPSLRAEADRLVLKLSAELRFTPAVSVPVAQEGQSWVVRLTSSKGEALGFGGIPVAWERSLRPSGPWKIQAGVTDENGMAQFPVLAEDKESNRLWYTRLRTDFERTGQTALAARLDAKTLQKQTLRHLSSLAVLFPEVVAVRSGSYWVGALANDVEAEPDEPAWRQVEAGAFSVQTTAVSMAAWRVFRDLNPGAVQANLWLENDLFGHDRKPVVGITWAEANAYAAWLSQFGARYRLPTETEREVFSRAGGEACYPWGSQLPSPSLAQFQGAGDSATLAVDALPQGKNAWGLWTTAGNVWEWTSTDAEGILGARGNWKAVKGGSWNSPAADLRLSNRRAQDPAVGRPDTGFRLVREDNP